jgi:hypothetical protein
VKTNNKKNSQVKTRLSIFHMWKVKTSLASNCMFGTKHGTIYIYPFLFHFAELTVNIYIHSTHFAAQHNFSIRTTRACWNKGKKCNTCPSIHLHIENWTNMDAHTEKIRNTDRGCRLWEVKNSGIKNSSPTEVKRTFIHQNLSIFIAKSMRNFCQTKNSPQNQRTYI